MIGTRKSGLWGKTTVIVAICFFALSAQAKYGGGTGEPNDPYLIYTATQMNAIGADPNDWDKCFKLMADIDLSGFDGQDGRPVFNIIAPDEDSSTWQFDGVPFAGVFDGNNHTISNFSYTSTGTNYLGLFGHVDNPNAEIKNLGLIDPDVDAGNEYYIGSLVGLIWKGTVTACYVEGGSVSGHENVGGLVGKNGRWSGTVGTITDCYSTASVSGDWYVGGLVGMNYGIINNCYSSGSASGDWLVGGLVGENFGTITNCCSTSSVSGNSCIGGMAGENWGTTTNCCSTGSVTGGNSVGGLVGSNYHGTITNSYSTAGASGNDCVGGLVGYNYGTISNCYSSASVLGNRGVGGLVGWDYYGTITNCYSTGSVAGNEYVGGMVGYSGDWSHCFDSFWDTETSGQTTSGSGTGLPTDEMQMASTFTDAGWDFENIWWILEGAGYPRFCWEDKYGGGSGRPSDPYLIYTAEQMNTIGVCKRDWDKHFKLMADIDLSAYTGTSFNIIGYWVSSEDHNPFTGVFDGNGHTISNFSYTSVDTDNCGLFSYVDESNAEIKDLGLIDPNLDAGTGDYVGSLVGRVSGGAITNCYVEGGSVSGDYYVGGLVGLNLDGTISNCYVTGTVSGFSSAHYGGIGGLVGRNDGTITNSYSSGSISGRDRIGGLVGYNFQGTITNSFSTGSVTGTSDVGGVVGLNRGTISNCYSTGSVSGGDYVGGLVGKNGMCLFYCNPGTISNCYSTGSVSDYSVLYSNVGGLVGYNESGTISTSFWDIDTSGQITSDGGTGKTTAEMQTMSTFTDAGWDFVGETVNGIEDIWFIPQQDYPHLWWEEMQVPMKLTPRTLNCRSEGNWVKAHLTLPQGFAVEDVDSNRPAVLHSFGIESAPLYVFVNKDKLVEIEAAFEREAICSLAGDWPDELTVAGFLADGSIFLGTSTVRIIHPGMNVIEELANCWLQGDCVHPDFCNEIDMNRDSLVNLADYALLMNINVEFVTDE